MKRYCLLVSAVLAASYSAQGQNCYQFSGSGVTLQITVQTITMATGPVDGVAFYNFNGTSSFTQGGTTQTSTEQFGIGAVSVEYLNFGSAGSTSIKFAVPNADPPGGAGNHFWTALLAGVGNLIPGQTLPSALPPLSAWRGVGNANVIGVTHGGAETDYPITSVTSCGSPGNPGGGGTPPPMTGATSPLQDLGDPNSIPGDCGCGEPINAGTGNVYYEVTDYKTAGANQLALTRYYNSLGAASGSTFATMLGPNWRTNYDRYLRLVSATQVIAERPTGQQVTFTLNGSTWTTDTDIDLALTNSGSTWTLTDHRDNVETYANSGSSEALLQTIQARNGYSQTLKYTTGNALTTVTDSYNRTLVFAVIGGLLKSVNTPDATTVTFSFTSGTLSTVGYSTTPVTTQAYVYGNSAFPNALTGIIDENGATYISWTYDSQGRALTGQFAGGAGLTTIVYNDTDGSRTVTNALGETDVYKFTTLENVPKVTEADRQAGSNFPAATSTYTYDANGYTASYTDWNGNQTRYVNDAHGQPLTITEAAGTPQARTTTVTYLSNFHLPQQIVAPGVTTSFTYDANGEVLTRTATDTTESTIPYSTNGQSRTWTYTYANSLMTSVKTPRTDLNGLSTITYDSSGSVTAVTNALNQTFKVTKHLQGGWPETIVDPNGVTVNLAYDGRQRRLSSAMTTSAGVLTTTYTYDPAGNLLSVAQPDGSTISSSYDSAHRLTGFSDLFGQKIELTLDGLGDRTQVAWVDVNGVTQRTHSANHDALGRMLQDIGGASQTTNYSYDSDGNVVKVVDALNHPTQRSFDAMNRLTGSLNAIGGTMTESYDAWSRPLSAADPDGATTEYVYDGFGDAIQRVSPATGTTVLQYDPSGEVTQRTDARGAVTNYTYDAVGRLTSQTYPGDSAENVSYTYDEAGHGFGIGRLTLLTDAAGTLSIDYDERGNILSETRVQGSATLVTSYNYDKASRTIAITYPSKTSVTYARDKMGRVTQVAAQVPGAAVQTILSGITYEPFGPVTGQTYGNGIVETRSYDQDYRLTKLASAGTAAVQSLSYSYDADNNISSIADGVTPGNGQNLGYDALSRLTSANGGYGALGYGYDANGNRLKETSPAANQDGLGSVTGLSYNQGGRLASASAGTQQLAQYTYDAYGQRIAKQAAASAVIYQYGQDHRLLEEANGQGAAQDDYIYLDGRPVAMVAVNTGGQEYFLHDDRLGTPQVATNKSQVSAWVANYQPFGALNAATSQTATLAQDLRLPGQVNDAETGLYQNGFRYYASAWGRYSQSDPIGLAGGLNTYAYVGGNPARLTDPLGLCNVVTNGDVTTLYGAGGSPGIYGTAQLVVPTSEWNALSSQQQQVVEEQVDDANAAFSEANNAISSSIFNQVMSGIWNSTLDLYDWQQQLRGLPTYEQQEIQRIQEESNQPTGSLGIRG